MKLTVFPGRDLPAEMRARWSDLQAGDPALASPYFRPEFTAAVAGARDDVFVAVLDGGAAFFPFQRGALGVGTPVGGPLSDYHGVIGRGVEPRALLRACGLRAWDFDHLPAAQAGFAPWKRLETNSPVIDLTQAGAGGSAKLRQQSANRHRKLAREVGKVTLEMHTEDDAIFRQVLAWKSAQYRVSGEFDIFATPWIRQVVETIRAHRDAPFAGSLAVLRAGGRPVAAHFGTGQRELVERLLHPQLDRLVHDDEQRLVMQAGQGMLRRQQYVELKIIGVGHAFGRRGHGRRLKA